MNSEDPMSVHCSPFALVNNLIANTNSKTELMELMNKQPHLFIDALHTIYCSQPSKRSVIITGLVVKGLITAETLRLFIQKSHCNRQGLLCDMDYTVYDSDKVITSMILFYETLYKKVFKCKNIICI